ncbi:MAG: D-glycero-alpha-D-manno-heptose-1,7-bisphosphate 7-phosphatase [Pirellulaceae bacterium]
MKTSKPARPAVFFDKDGTLVENVPHNVDCEKIRLMKGAGAAARKLHEAGYALVVVTNQSGVALGYFGIEDVFRVERRLTELLALEGAPLSGFYFCPHLPFEMATAQAPPCSCRKPWSGMLLQARRELNLDLARSWMVGDILDDVEAGHRAGCRAILFETGAETCWKSGALRVPDYSVTTLAAAARQILAVGDAMQAPDLTPLEMRS